MRTPQLVAAFSLALALGSIACSKESSMKETSKEEGAGKPSSGPKRSCADSRGFDRVPACYEEKDLAALDKALDQECWLAGADTWKRNKQDCFTQCKKISTDEELRGKPVADKCKNVLGKQ
ncbi:MAG: hypothetical protein HYV09_12910 [Deltaproteobacteria bacterium]|nr:hypothetical protein [Deltaproteobacteria bacterium]